MMNFARQRMFTILFLSCAVLYTSIVCNHAKTKVVTSTEKKALVQKSLSNAERQRIDSALEKMIMYTHDIGKWLEALFDTENNVPYAEHVENLKKIVTTINQDFAPSQNDEDMHPTIQTTHELALLLVQKVEHTYAVLKSYCGGSYILGHVRLGMALKKVLNSSSEQAEFDMVFQDLHGQLEVLAPELNAKLNDVKGTLKLYSERINSQGWHTLTNGLWHRLSCKEQDNC